jgi:hypothetical protein
MLDFERIVPEARAIVEQAALVYVRHAGDDFVGLVVHGSAVKGGFIPGCSDIDFQLYLREEAFDEHGYLPFERTLAIHRDLARIDPAPFQYLQGYAFGGAPRVGWTGPIPGTYAIVAGKLPVPEATSEELRAAAEALIREIDPNARVKDALLDHGGGRLARQVRLICTDVWPALYCLLVVKGGKPIAVWNMTKQEAIAMLPEGSVTGQAIRGFYQELFAYYPGETSTDAGLDVLLKGVTFLRAARDEQSAGQV